MKISYSDIKKEFSNYLSKLPNKSNGATKSKDINIFKYFDEFKSYLESEYEIDPSSLSIETDILTAMKSISKELELDELDEALKDTDIDSEDEIVTKNNEDEEITDDETIDDETIDKTEEITDDNEDKDKEDDDFILDLLDDFLNEDSVKKIADDNEDGVLQDEEIQSFLKQIISLDKDDKNLSFEDLMTAYTQIKDGTFETEEDEETEISEVEDTDSPVETSNSTATGGTGGGGGGGNGGVNNQNNTPQDTQTQKSDDYSQMSIDELKTEKTTKENELKSAQEDVQKVCSGENKEVKEKQEICDNKQKEYEEAIKNDKQIEKELKERCLNNANAISAKEAEITETQQAVLDKQFKIYSIQNEIADLTSTLSALNAAKTELESKQGTDTDAQADIIARLAEVEAQIESVTQKKTEKEEELSNLENDKTLEEKLEQQQAELKELNDEKDEIDKEIIAQASEETKSALDNWNKAKEVLEATKEAQLKIATEKLGGCKTDLEKVNTVLREKEATATKNEMVGKADLFTDANFDVQKITRDGMDYIVISPKGVDTTQELPVMVYLHGGGEFGNNLSQIEQTGLLKMIENNPEYFGKTFNGYIIMPQSSDSWSNKGNELRAIVNEFSQTHAIDRNNIVIAGHSMGGGGTLMTAADNSDHFFSRALILSAVEVGESVLNSINIPVYGVSGNGEQRTADIVNYIARKNNTTSYYKQVPTGHGSVPAYAFNIDDNGNGHSDLIELLFPDYA